jgi:hypothetical protein
MMGLNLYTHSQYVITWLSFKRCRGNGHNKAIEPYEDNMCHNRPYHCQSEDSASDDTIRNSNMET